MTPEDLQKLLEALKDFKQRCGTKVYGGNEFLISRKEMATISRIIKLIEDFI